ncbi:MAG TPA: alkaline phosphatase D family protein [Microvirga sp.]|nr:alkaline phosphatase D family protein [Microvirga sp.]
MGPVLIFRGSAAGRWHLSALVTGTDPDAPPALAAGSSGVPARALARRGDQVLWRYDFAFPLEEAPRDCAYRLGEAAYRVRVPAAQGALRLAFTACNGSEHGNAWGDPDDRNALWLDLARRHRADPFHLLLQGGDQLYADPIWRHVPALSEWRSQPWRKRRKAGFSAEMAEGVSDFYFEGYRALWEQPQLAPLLACVPSLMMWDDHDILDGWGSYAPERQDCAVLQGIWSAAREHFSLFQLGAEPHDLPEGFSARGGEHFGWAYRVGDVGLIAPDLRSERSRRWIMGEAGWAAFQAALAGLEGCRHVLLVSTVPLVNAHLTPVERLFDLVPGHQSWQDDLVDQWVSLAHWDEWARMLDALLAFSARTDARVTSLSGEIHLGALGVIEGRGARVHQLTSSGIVHPPPPPFVARVLELCSMTTFRVAPGITARTQPMPGSGRRYLRARNWLELDLPAGGNLRACWHAEGRAEPMRLAIPAGCR